MKDPALRKELRVFLILSLGVILLTALFWGEFVPFALLLCGIFIPAHYFTARLRYRRLQQLSLDLDRLLHSGVPMPISDYAEGELAVLGSQIQKMTLRLTEAAETLARDKADLADAMADISHKLRTPLTAMNLTVSMLSAPELPEARRLELTRELRRLLSRTDWLVEALLKLSRLDAGTVTFAAEPVAVADLIRQAATPLAIPMELREQRLRVHCGAESFCGDLTWTAEALGNLLKNAVEHTPVGGAITVTARETALFTQIDVEDTGSGFVPEDIPRLFERFYKGKNASEHSYGIGLALARKIVAEQNGTIQAMNTSTGAKFTIKFYKQII